MLNPKININGDHPDTLTSELNNALSAVREAHDAIAKVTVNGRNYQTMMDDHQQLEEDKQRKIKILSFLTELEAELSDDCLAIMGQAK